MTESVFYDNGRIEVRSDGEIFINGNHAKYHEDSEGYYRVTLKGFRERTRVHRIIAETFVENKENKPQVDHIDGNKKNNDVSNLRWVTVSENLLNAGKHGAWKKHHSKRRRIIAKNKSNGNISYFESIKQAEISLNIPSGSINKNLSGKRNSCHGFEFSYDESNNDKDYFQYSLPIF